MKIKNKFADFEIYFQELEKNFFSLKEIYHKNPVHIIFLKNYFFFLKNYKNNNILLKFLKKK